MPLDLNFRSNRNKERLNDLYEFDELLSLARQGRLEIWEPVMVMTDDYENDDDVEFFSARRTQPPVHVYYIAPKDRVLDRNNLIERFLEVDSVKTNLSQIGLREEARQRAENGDFSMLMIYCVTRPWMRQTYPSVEYLFIRFDNHQRTWVVTVNDPSGIRIVHRIDYHHIINVERTKHVIHQPYIDAFALIDCINVQHMLSAGKNMITIVDQNGRLPSDGIFPYRIRRRSAPQMDLLYEAMEAVVNFEQWASFAGQLIAIRINDEINVGMITQDTEIIYQIFSFDWTSQNYGIFELNDDDIVWDLHLIKRLFTIAHRALSNSPLWLDLNPYHIRPRINEAYRYRLNSKLYKSVKDLVQHPFTYSNEQIVDFTRDMRNLLDGHNIRIVQTATNSNLSIIAVSNQVEETGDLVAISAAMRTNTIYEELLLATELYYINRGKKILMLEVSNIGKPFTDPNKIRIADEWFRNADLSLFVLDDLLTVPMLKYIIHGVEILNNPKAMRKVTQLMLKTDMSDDVNFSKPAIVDLTHEEEIRQSWKGSNHLLYIPSVKNALAGHVFLSDSSSHIYQYTQSKKDLWAFEIIDDNEFNRRLSDIQIRKSSSHTSMSEASKMFVRRNNVSIMVAIFLAIHLNYYQPNSI